jgi:RNA polymerase sigma-70 factor (ECF subfamily)
MKVKIISLFRDEYSLVRKAASGDRGAQKAIYGSLAPRMLALCQRYVRDAHFAEDVMIEGFVKVFANLPGFRFQGSFEGWVRRIMVREAIDFLRRRQFVVYDETLLENRQELPDAGADPYEVEQLELLIDALPEGYRLVFNLYVVEGYKHHEIATLLDISESTSKSQLFKARKALQNQLEEISYHNYGIR